LNALGNTLIHEHIICTSPEFFNEYNNWLPRQQVLDIACAKVRYAAEKYNIKTIVDGTPLSLGRNLKLLQEVSQATNVNIIASAGFYFYPSFSQRQLPVATLAKFMIEEITDGAIKPAILKCAIDADSMTNDVKKMLSTVAEVQLATGLPVFMHSSSHKRNGLEALELFVQAGVDPRKVIVGHTADAGDASYPLELLDKGCLVSIDRIKPENAAQRTGVLLEVIKHGDIDRIFIAHDHICCRGTVMNNPPAPQGEPHGLDTIHTMVLPQLPEAVADKLLRENIIKLYQG
jgi:phosphotriesterase-related protein